MDKKHKMYLKLNILSLFFLGVSFISISLAWFAYSGITNVATEIDVKTWSIEFQKDGQPVSNEIILTLPNVYPGMETVYESVKITNKGDTDAKLSYSIESASILDETFSSTPEDIDTLKDIISHEYPFKINMSLSKNFVLGKTDSSMFDLSVSWPFDSGDDDFDTLWGTKAYNFLQTESTKPLVDQRPPIRIIISVKAEQFNDSDDTAPDINYPVGKTIIYDYSNNKVCSDLSSNSTCITTHVIDTDNKIGDDYVNLLPDLYESYPSGTFGNYQSLRAASNWTAPTRELTINDLIKLISSDVTDSIITSDKYSSTLIGFAKSDSRVNYLVNKAITYGGHFSFLNDRFEYLATNKCYWVNTEYDTNRGFALTKIDEFSSKIYGENKNSTCSVVPVIVAHKDNLK